MQISQSDWIRYIRRLRAIDDTATNAVEAWMTAHPAADGDDLVSVCYAYATRYGEAAASLACDMYDATAVAQGVIVAAAEPAATATMDETTKAVFGTLNNRRSTVGATVGRLVKQAGADTMLKNAARDGAEWAWIPQGDTCAFCLMLASNGWQRQSKGSASGHAEHIHANCDCTYAVRFDGKSSVQGYDPEALRARYNAAEGRTWQEKLNSMRREQYAAKHDDE